MTSELKLDIYISDFEAQYYLKREPRSVNLSCNERLDFAFYQIKNAVAINLSYTNVTDHHIETLFRNNPDLDTLDVSGCEKLSQFAFTQFRHLKTLYAPQTNIISLNEIVQNNVDSLEQLNIASCFNLSAEQDPIIGQLKQLKRLHICRFATMSLESTLRIDTLRQLHIEIQQPEDVELYENQVSNCNNNNLRLDFE